MPPLADNSDSEEEEGTCSDLEESAESNEDEGTEAVIPEGDSGQDVENQGSPHVRWPSASLQMARARGIDKGIVCLKSISITHLANKAHFVIRRDADLIAIQEHKLNAKGISELTETFRQSGWDL